MSKIRIGLVGFGGICNGVHVPGYLECDDAKITAVCDINPDKLKLAKEKLKLDESRLFTNYNDMIKSGLIDAVDIATPNDVHCKAAHAAIDAGLPFSVEKPVGLNYKEVKDLFDRANETNTKSFVCLSWRYTAETRFLRDLVKNHIGKIYHIYAKCIKDSALWEGRKLEWRFDKEKSGTGALGDLGPHMIDIVRFMGEEFDTVQATGGTYIKDRPTMDGNNILPVTVDDWCNINCMTKNGVPVMMSVSRAATSVDITQIEIYGENGAVVFDSHYDCGWEKDIRVCIGSVDLATKGWHSVKVPSKYNAIQSKSFVNMLNGIDDEYTAKLVQGVECQKVLEAAEISMNTGKVVKISEIE